MIYNKQGEYKVKFYRNEQNNKSPVLDYIDNLNNKEKAKVLKYIEFLRINRGILDEPYSKHIKGKIRELRIDFSKNGHRIFYFTFVNKNIILLSAFLKKTAKTPAVEIKKAENHYYNMLKNHNNYE